MTTLEELQELNDLTSALEGIGHEQGEVKYHICTADTEKARDLMYYFSGGKLIELSHKRIYSRIHRAYTLQTIALQETKTLKIEYGRTLEGPPTGVALEAAKIKALFPEHGFRIYEIPKDQIPDDWS